MMDFMGLFILTMESLIAGYGFYRLAKPFLGYKKKALYIGAVYFLVMMMLHAIPVILDIFFGYFMSSMAAFLVMCRLDRRNYRQKAFITVTFFSLQSFTLAMVTILYDELYGAAADSDYMQQHPNQWPVLYIVACAIYLTLELLFLVAAIRCILKSYAYKNAEMSGKELLMLSMPSFMGIIGYKTMWHYRTFFIIETGKMPNLYDMLLLLYYTIAIAAIMAVIILYQKIKAGQEEKLQNELLAVQIENTEKHIERVENLYQNIRSMKHDMTNHIITLDRLYARNKEEAKVYSKELKEALSEAAGTINSGNPVTDVILQEMQNEAEKRQIDLQIDFHYPAASNVNTFDISVILNNALQNALDYSDKNEHSIVSVFSYRRNNAYMIEIHNSFTGNIKWDAESGLPMTSTERTNADSDNRDHRLEQIHGYGLSNIRRVALKYAGDIAIDVRDGMFCLSILLMMD